MDGWRLRRSASVVGSQFRRCGRVDARGCAATADSIGVSAWLEHNREGFTENDDDNVLQPPTAIHMGHNVVRSGTSGHEFVGVVNWVNQIRVDGGIATTVSECDCGVLVSRSEFEPFRGRENGSNPNLDANSPISSRRTQPSQAQSQKTKHSTGTPFPRRCQKMFHGD